MLQREVSNLRRRILSSIKNINPFSNSESKSATMTEKEELVGKFILLGELGIKFAEVITGNITMDEFKEYHEKLINKLQKELAECKLSLIDRPYSEKAFDKLQKELDESCTEKQEYIADLQLFSLLLTMNSIEEWEEWFQKYTKITSPIRIIQSVDMNVVRPIVFDIQTDKFYTYGDQKPLWILAVLAARNSVVPVYVYAFRRYSIPDEIQHLAVYYIGLNWKERLIFVGDNEFERLMLSEQGYVLFTSLHVSHPASVNMIALDFGDSREEPPNTHRFVTCLMSNFRPQARHFGSLYLPLEFDWSGPAELKRLRDFTKKYNKIVCFAGSQQVPMAIKEIIEWLDRGTDWAVVLVGWQWSSDPDFKQLDLYKQVIYFQYISYEDVAKRVDFFITNCGAGSAAVAFAAGCPQQCDKVWSSTGGDKYSNRRAIVNHKVGPRWKGRDLDGEEETSPLWQRMADIDKNYNSYLVNAEIAERQMNREFQHLWTKMSEFFERLSQDVQFQTQVLKEGIPDEYSLGTCPI